jgi:hypothetical protein
MTRILTVGRHSGDLAAERTVEALFTTIGCRLEPHGRGSRFPAIMDDLYSGYLTPARASKARQELQEIEDALRAVPVRDVVWNLGNLQRGDDSAEPVNHRASNAFEYFVDNGGRPLITRLREGVQECLNTAQVMRLAYPGEVRQGRGAGLVLMPIGFAWMYFGHRFIPTWCLKHFSAAIPIWTFGMDFVMLGAGFTIAMCFPGVTYWFRRRPMALPAIAITCVIGWLVVCAHAGWLPD